MKSKATCKILSTGAFILILNLFKAEDCFPQLRLTLLNDAKISYKELPAGLNGVGYVNVRSLNKDSKVYYNAGNLNPAIPFLTLRKCYEIALAKNGNIKQERNNITAAFIDQKIARYSLLPSASYNMGHYFSFGKNIDPVTNAFSFESFSGGYTTLGLELDLFSGFRKINSIKQSNYRIKASAYNEKNTELQLLTNITLTYSKLLLAKEELSYKRNVIDNITKELYMINEKIKVGRLTKYEFYTFNARLNTEQAELIALQNDSLNTLQDLKELMNVSYKDKVDIAPIDEMALQNIYAVKFSEAGLVETILLSHPAIKQAETITQAARIQLKITRSNFLPSLYVAGNLVSNYNTDQNDITGRKIPLSSQLNNNLGKNINIGLSIPIFSQMENVNQTKKEKIHISNAQLEAENVKNSITSGIIHLVNDFTSAKEKYKVTHSAYEQNKLSYDLYMEKYRLGQLSSVELITAQDILNSSTSKYIESKLQLYFQFQLLELLKQYCSQ